MYVHVAFWAAHSRVHTILFQGINIIASITIPQFEVEIYVAMVTATKGAYPDGTSISLIYLE